MSDRVPDGMKDEQWTNHGDVNPIPHGGCFLRWENGQWQIVRTRNGSELPDEVCPDDESWVEELWAEPQDVFKNGDYTQGFSEEMMTEFDKFSRIPFDPEAINDPIEGHTTAEAMEYRDKHGDLKWILGSLAVYHEFGRSRFDRTVSNDEYWNELEDMFGITEESNE